MRNLKKLGSAILLASMFLFSACSKTEFLPDPEGAQVPFQNNATQTVDELLAASPAKLYYTAWQKSNIKNILKQNGNKVVYTVFAPNDAAMQAAGLTAAAINQLPVAELDSLMMFYTTIGYMTKDELKLRNDNFVVKTLLIHPGLYVPYYEGNSQGTTAYDDYYYKHFVALKGDDLLMNGKNVGKANYLPATNGGVYLMEKAIEKPTKTILEALKADGRFTIFLESQRLTDELFLSKISADIEALFGMVLEDEDIMRDYASNRLFYKKDWGVNAPIYPGYFGPNVTVSTLFAPTDEAFHKAGFQTVADVMEFNKRSASTVLFDENTYQAAGGYPMDTVYSFHRNWGRIVQTASPNGDKAINNATVFYSNVLNPALNNYLVNAGGNVTVEYAYNMPLEFSVNNNMPQVKVKGSEYPAASVIEGDINTLNGPIHVVDRLLFPKGFKLK
ncbi:fasciclin domain-containing protein [Pedobacter nototheniae]|uniref:fasciclin domain-containing protein n=1 Tax=Pedobacter nototheniae TaxID=2488994 RepID=UPI00292FFF72|nr:fasciclin domain-containing protein [Pedobacter nototheniae]